MSYYSDQVINEAIDALDRDDEMWITDDLVERLTEVQWSRYRRAIDRLWMRLAVRVHDDWWRGQRDAPVPSTGVWSWESADAVEQFLKGEADG